MMFGALIDVGCWRNFAVSILQTGPHRFNPQGLSVDHSQGGEHSYANTQLAHILCNSLRNRGDRMVQMRLCG